LPSVLSFLIYIIILIYIHTQFSLLDGASNIARLYEKAAKDNMPAMAITDHGNMFGVSSLWPRHGRKKSSGQNRRGQGHTGAGGEAHGGLRVLPGGEPHQTAVLRDEKDQRCHQLLLAKNEIGYKNLVKLCSLGFIEGLYGKYPRIDKELVLQYHEGLIATTCCLGAEVPRTILRKGEEEAEKSIQMVAGPVWRRLLCRVAAPRDTGADKGERGAGEVCTQIQCAHHSV
jgi:DNA polymerase-3 subunit alpha